LAGCRPHDRLGPLLDFDLERRGEVDVVGQVAVPGEKHGLDTPVTRILANLIRGACRSRLYLGDAPLSEVRLRVVGVTDLRCSSVMVRVAMAIGASTRAAVDR